MNVQDLLQRIVTLLPAFQQAGALWLRALPLFAQATGAFVGAVGAFVAAQGGWQGILQTLAQSRIGQAARAVVDEIRLSFPAIYSAGRAVGSFVGSAAGMAASAAGSVASTVGSVVSAVAGLVATPLGAVALAAAGAGLALAALGVVTERVGRAFLETQRHLANSSAAMAMVFAQSDLRRTFREMRAGNEQAGIAGFLARGLDNLADTLQPILSLLTNIANVVLGVLVRVVDLLVKPISFVAELIGDFFKWVKDHWPWGGGKDDDPLLLSQWLDRVADESRRDHARNGPFRGLKFS